MKKLLLGRIKLNSFLTFQQVSVGLLPIKTELIDFYRNKLKNDKFSQAPAKSWQWRELLGCRTLKFLIAFIFIVSLNWPADRKIRSWRQHCPDKRQRRSGTALLTLCLCVLIFRNEFLVALPRPSAWSSDAGDSGYWCFIWGGIICGELKAAEQVAEWTGSVAVSPAHEPPFPYPLFLRGLPEWVAVPLLGPKTSSQDNSCLNSTLKDDTEIG